MAEGMERESKFLVSGDFELPTFDGIAASSSSVKLVATYWDTADRRLLRRGHTLRHRQASDGSEDGWTLKLGVPPGSTDPRGVIDRREITHLGSTARPPVELTRLTAGIVGRERLTPVATLETERRVATLEAEGGASVEVSDDRVSAAADGVPSLEFRQIEIEIKRPGSERLLERVERLLVERGATRTASSKLETVLGGRFEPEVVPSPLRPRSSVDALVRFAIASGYDRLLQQDPWVRIGDDEEAVHRARVATRRLRSDLKTLEPLLGASPQRLREELQWLGGLLGTVRDLDVLVGRVEELARGLPAADRRAATAITGALRNERRRRRRELIEGLASPRYLDLLDDLANAARRPGLRDGVRGRARPAMQRLVRKAWRRTASAVKKLGDDPADAELHEIRKRAKRARYAAELGTGVFGSPSERFAKRLAEVQDVLGELQDTVVAEERLRSIARSDARLAGEPAFVAGVMAGLERDARDRARARWPRSWKSARKDGLRRWLG